MSWSIKYLIWYLKLLFYQLLAYLIIRSVRRLMDGWFDRLIYVPLGRAIVQSLAKSIACLLA